MTRGSRVRFALLSAGAALVAGVLGTLLVSARLEKRTEQAPTSEASKLLDEVVARLSAAHDIPRDSLYLWAARALVENSGDPYAQLMDPEEYQDFAASTGGAFGGIGSSVDLREGFPTLVEPVAGSPAERAGLQRGDQIVEIDGQSTDGWSIDEVVDALRGPVGESVTLRIRRDGVALPQPFEVVRASVSVPSVIHAYRTEEGIGVIQLSSFGHRAAFEFEAALSHLESEGDLEGLVLDLRGNPGGLLEEALAVADLFLPTGEVLTISTGVGGGVNSEYRARDEEDNAALPIAVLVDGHTASAAEVLAGALQDHDRAVVVGEPTFGKGSVQSIVSLPGGYRLKVTTARWYTPEGRGLDRLHDAFGGTVIETGDRAPSLSLDTGAQAEGSGGIQPDVEVADSVVAVRKRAAAQLKNEESGKPFRDLIFAYARRLARDSSLTAGAPPPRDAIDALIAEARRSDLLRVTPNLPVLREYLSFELGYQTAQLRGGSALARRFSDAHDMQVRTAIDLIRASSSSRERMNIASARGD